MDNFTAYVEELLDFAKTVIPAAAQTRTPLHIYATAGMRLLSPEHQAEILKGLCDIAKDRYAFLVDPDGDGRCLRNIRIISGEEEGTFGWLSVNYLLKSFENMAAFAKGHLQTYGFLDMGGASAQLAFQPTAEVEEMHLNDMRNITLRTLDGTDHIVHLYVNSFLGYGSNEARRRYLETLQSKGASVSDSTPYKDPCLPKGLLHEESNMTLLGTGDFESCLKNARPLLNKSVSCREPPCLINGIHTPPLDYIQKQYVGISEYWYSTHDILGISGGYKYSEFEHLALQFCSQEWDHIKHKYDSNGYSSNTNIERLQMQCFKASWLLNFLYEGMELPKQDCLNDAKRYRHILRSATCSKYMFQAVHDVGAFEVSWTLGAALLQSLTTIPVCNSLIFFAFVTMVLVLLMTLIVGSLSRLYNSFYHDDDHNLSIPLTNMEAPQAKKMFKTSVNNLYQHLEEGGSSSGAGAWTGSRANSPLAPRALQNTRLYSTSNDNGD
jgi:Golgi nucleoside diphosphatase